MVKFINNIQEKGACRLSALPTMGFFELDKEIYALIVWDEAANRYSCWRCKDGEIFTFGNIYVKPVNVTITATGYAD